MFKHKNLTDDEVLRLIKAKKITFAGWDKGKIYGHLNCPSGKHKMKREHRVFFESEAEALAENYRPCAICMKEAYKVWKAIQS